MSRGLYWLLCALHRVIFVTGTTISQQVIEDVMSMRVLEVDRNALRHTRDYLVLRDFEHLLDRPEHWLDHPETLSGPPGEVLTTLKHLMDHHLENFLTILGHFLVHLENFLTTLGYILDHLENFTLLDHPEHFFDHLVRRLHDLAHLLDRLAIDFAALRDLRPVF